MHRSVMGESTNLICTLCGEGEVTPWHLGTLATINSEINLYIEEGEGLAHHGASHSLIILHGLRPATLSTNKQKTFAPARFELRLTKLDAYWSKNRFELLWEQIGFALFQLLANPRPFVLDPTDKTLSTWTREIFATKLRVCIFSILLSVDGFMQSYFTRQGTQIFNKDVFIDNEAKLAGFLGR